MQPYYMTASEGTSRVQIYRVFKRGFVKHFATFYDEILAENFIDLLNNNEQTVSYSPTCFAR